MAAPKHACKLADEHCIVCREGGAPLNKEQIEMLICQLSPRWRISTAGHLEKLFKFQDFRQALSFVNCLGVLAEAEQHHPDIYLAWGRVKVMLWTHSIHGLSENDFILAARIDQL